ncbi:MAG: hypothetical protein LBH95_05495, partial [Oscillospiraceae bacterium]|nr:hypothetical protein [Oscillospiraceae bacterium]
MEFLQGIFSRVRGWFAGIWEKTEKRDRMRFLVISAIAVVLIIAATVMLNSGRYEEVYRNSSSQNVRAASAALTAGNIRHKISGDAILVDKKVAPDGLGVLAATDEVNMEDLDFNIYGMATGLTSTDADRREYRKMQLQHNLKKTLEAYPMVSGAVVILEMPENKGIIYVGEEKPASAAVVLNLNAEIKKSQIETVEMIVVKATGVEPANIAISDQNMRLLNKKEDEEDISVSMMVQYDLAKKYEQEMEDKLTRLIAPLYGPENFSIGVSMDFDFDDVSSESITFTPVVGDDEGIARSLQTMTEYAKGSGFYGGEP